MYNSLRDGEDNLEEKMLWSRGMDKKSLAGNVAVQAFERWSRVKSMSCAKSRAGWGGMV